MGNVLKFLFLAVVIFGIIWVSKNVDFNKIFSETSQKIQNEKTVTRVINGRERAIEDVKKVVE